MYRYEILRSLSKHCSSSQSHLVLHPNNTTAFLCSPPRHPVYWDLVCVLYVSALLLAMFMASRLCVRPLVISVEKTEVFLSSNLVWTSRHLRITHLRTLSQYRVIRKSLRDFRPLRYSSRDGHAEGGHVNRRRDTPKFLSCLTGARYFHPWWRGKCQSCNQVPATQVRCTCAAGTWLQGWHFPRHQGWTYRAPVR